MKKVTFVNEKRQLVGTLFTIYKHFGDCIKCVLRFCCKFSMQIIFYLPVNTDKPKFVAFLVFFCTNPSLIAQISSSGKCREARRHLGSGPKIVYSQGYSELRKPIKTREKCYSLMWSILIWDIHGLRWKLGLGLKVALGQGLGLLHQFYLKVRVRVRVIHVIKIQV